MIRRGVGRRTGRSSTGTTQPLAVTSHGERVHVVHTGGRPPAPLTDIAGRLGPAGQDEVVVLVGAPLGAGGVDALCEQLSPMLEESRKADIRVLRLVMSAGADEAEGRHSTARLICERWGFDVLATAGAAVVVPDGTLFSPDLPDAPGGWWHFSSGEVPRRVGSRLPIPDWEPALERVSRMADAGHVVEPVPAGLLVRPAQTTAPTVHGLPYAVPPDPDRPQVLIGAPSVSADALANVIAALPGRLRQSVRLLSLDGQDLIGTGHAVADLLGAETQVALGVPVVMEDAMRGDVSVSPRMVGTDGNPTWRPFVEAVTCPPVRNGVRPPFRVSAWRAPAGLRQGGGEPDALPLDGRWKVAVTPAGLWIGSRSTEPPLAAVTRPVSHDVMAIDLGAPRRALDDSLWPHLDKLLQDMRPEERDRTVVHIHGVLGAKGMEHLRRLAVRHGFSLLAQEHAPQAAAGGDPDGVRLSDDPLLEEVDLEVETEVASEPEQSQAVETGPTPGSSPGFTAHTLNTSLATAYAHTPSVAPVVREYATASAGAAATPPSKEQTVEEPAASATATPAVSAPPVQGTQPQPPVTEMPSRTAVKAQSHQPTTEAQPQPPAARTQPQSPAAQAQSRPATAASLPSASGATSTEASALTSVPLPSMGHQRPAPTTREGRQTDHEKLRASLGPFWERHTRAASRAMTRMPGIRTQDGTGASMAHLAAVHVYMTAVDDSQLDSSLSDDDSTLTLLRCLEWGLRRLPSYRGATISTNPWLTTKLTPDLVGTRLVSGVPVRATAVDGAYSAPSADHMLIWSVTGRRTSVLMEGDGKDILFSQHSGFRVLGVIQRGSATVGLLRELPPHDRSSDTRELNGPDVALLYRLRAVLDLPSPAADDRSPAEGQ